MSNTDILNNLPSKEDLITLIEGIQGTIELDDCDDGMIDITVASNGKSPYEWAFQTGDNSYSGACYFYRHWAIGYIDDQTSPNDLAIELLDQLEELVAYDDLMMEC
tara:strand:- start:347 stop:664 length:318 start_codon:yes stop_codon:yes gene_type:complete